MQCACRWIKQQQENFNPLIILVEIFNKKFIQNLIVFFIAKQKDNRFYFSQFVHIVWNLKHFKPLKSIQAKKIQMKKIHETREKEYTKKLMWTGEITKWSSKRNIWKIITHRKGCGAEKHVKAFEIWLIWENGTPRV